jgi:cytochrome c oxidase assembly factor CtaG
VRILWQRAGAGRIVTRAQVAAFAAGMFVIAVALLSPIDALSGALFSVHMVQHTLLIAVAPPLLVLGSPGVPVLWALPRPARLRVVRGARRLRILQALRSVQHHPFIPWALAVVAFWAWHAPSTYQAALGNGFIHALEHASFVATSALFWWVLLERGPRRRRPYGAGVAYLVAMAVQGSMLGALLTVSSAAWYPAYATSAPQWGLTPLEDQQLAGLIMWIPAGVIYAIAAALLFVDWLHAVGAEQARMEQTAAS